MKITRGRTVPADNFVGTISANVDNTKLSDKEFREFIRNTLPIVKFKSAEDNTPEVIGFELDTESGTARIIR